MSDPAPPAPKDPPPAPPAPPPAKPACSNCKGGVKSLEKGKLWYCEPCDLVIDPEGDARPAGIEARISNLEKKINPVDGIVRGLTGKGLEDVTLDSIPFLGGKGGGGFADILGGEVSKLAAKLGGGKRGKK